MKASIRILAICFALAFALAHQASANLVLNADYSSITYSGTLPLTTVYGMFGSETGHTLTLTDWTTDGYNFVYAPSTADAGDNTTGALSGQPNEAPGQFNNTAGYGDTFLWGTQNSGSNGMPSTSPLGGNIIAMDGTYERSAVSQTITGLKPNDVYVLKFYWAGAQQESFSGTTSESIDVSLGGTTLSTGTTFIASHGFSGWMQDTMYFTATNASETLSFLASGAPNGEPPFSLMSGVDLEVIPEFSNWMIFAGFGAVCVGFEVVRRRRRAECVPTG